MTQSNLLELAQQGDPQAIAALMNQSLQPRGMTATVERLGDRLSVLLEADQVPNRQTLTAFVHRGISNLGIESIRSVKVLGQQIGTNLPVWTQELTLELPTTAAEAIDAVDLSSSVDSRVDLSPTVTTDDDELEALWIAPSDEQSQDSLADLLAEEPTDDLQGLFDDQPEELEAGIGSDNPLEDLRNLFGEQSEADFPPLEESSFNRADLNSMGAVETNSLQDLFGEDPEEDPLAQLDGMFSEPTFTESNLDLFGEDPEEDPLAQLDGMFSEPTFTESNLDLSNDLDSELDRNLNADLGLESSNSNSLADNSLADLFGDRSPDEALGMFEEIPPDEEEFQDLFGETDSGTLAEEERFEGVLEQPSPEAIAPETWSLLDEELSSESTEVANTDDPLMNLLEEDPSVIGEDLSINDTSSTTHDQFISFSGEELSPDLSFLEESSSEETLLSELTEEDSLLDFLEQESEQSEDLLGAGFTGVEAQVSEPLLFNESGENIGYSANVESIDEPLLFNEFGDEPVSSNEGAIDEPLLFDELGDDPVSLSEEAIDEPLLFNELAYPDAIGAESIDEPLLFNEFGDEPVSLNERVRDDDLLFDEIGDKPISLSEGAIDEPLLFNEFDEFGEFGDEPISLNEGAIDEPLLFDELGDEPVSLSKEAIDEPLLFDELGDEPVSLDSLESADESTFLEPEPSFASSSSSSTKSFQEQQALADFFADDPLADFLAQPVQPAQEEFLEGGLSESMATATAQNYFTSPEVSTRLQTENLSSVPPFQAELQDEQDQDRTFQSTEPADLFSERMNSLEAEFPQDFQVDALEQPDRHFLGNDNVTSLDNWDGGLENPLPDVEIRQDDTVSPLESLTDDSDLYNLQTEALFQEPSYDRYSEAAPNPLVSQPDRWDLDSDDEPTAIENPLPPAVRPLGESPRAGALEDLTVSLPNLPDDGYEQPVAYPSLNDPTQAPPQPKGSPWIFPLVLFGLTGWILALIGLSYFLKDRDTTQPPIVQPSTAPAPSVPPAPASPSSALPSSEDSATLPKSSDWMAVD